jgi:hypothetical protein
MNRLLNEMCFGIVSNGRAEKIQRACALGTPQWSKIVYELELIVRDVTWYGDWNNMLTILT